jgi:protein TonB
MEDRVSDVLAERAALDSGLTAAVAFSLALHLAAAAAAVTAARRQPPPTPAEMVNIRFAPMRPTPHATSRSRIPDTPRIEEPKPEAPVTPPPKPPPKAAEKTVPISAFGKSTQKGSDNPPVAPVAPAEPATPAIPVGGSGVTGIEGGYFPYTIYIDRMQTLIGGHWFRPQVGPGTTTTVQFSIERDGTIRDARTESASGNGTFDRAALRAVLEASPLPPLPFGYNGTSLGVHLTFR